MTSFTLGKSLTELPFPDFLFNNNEEKEVEKENRIETLGDDDNFDPNCPNSQGTLYRFDILLNSSASTFTLAQGMLPLAPIGDVNDDGYSDIMFLGGISGLCTNFTIYVLYGSSSLPTELTWGSITGSEGFSFKADSTSFPISSTTVYSFVNTTGPQCIYDPVSNVTNDYYTYYYSYSIASSASISFYSAGDFNKDGFADIILGSSYAYQLAGQSYLFYGSDTVYNQSIVLSQITKSQGFSIIGSGRSNDYYSGDQSGFAVAGGFDFNNDGYSDIAIGAPQVSSMFGAVYIIYGNSNTPKSLKLSFLAPSLGITIFNFEVSRLGNSLSPGGDYNNDGYDDLAIGAPSAAGGAGGAFIIYGVVNKVNLQLNSLTASQGKYIIGIKNTNKANGYCQTGSMVGGAFDFNRDGKKTFRSCLFFLKNNVFVH